MDITKELEDLRDFPSSASKEFREQLAWVKASADRCVGVTPQPAEQKGIDRSRELTPVPRPAIVRSLVREGPL